MSYIWPNSFFDSINKKIEYFKKGSQLKAAKFLSFPEKSFKERL